MEQLQQIESVAKQRQEVGEIVRGYIRHKAKRFLELGHERYRKGDALEKPSQDLEAVYLDALSELCGQLVSGKGFDAESPLTTSHVPASYALIDLFHFGVAERRSNYRLANGILDEFLCRHVVTGTSIKLFVLVASAEVPGVEVR